MYKECKKTQKVPGKADVCLSEYNAEKNLGKKTPKLPLTRENFTENRPLFGVFHPRTNYMNVVKLF